MGVPAFYRWLVEKYPKIVAELLEARDKVIDGNIIPLDLTEPNPNEIEYDNLYIDMNGLIHPCSHPEDREAPATEAEMYLNVTKYIDRLFAAVRPRRLLYLAIDGVAPRAKMNQQRSRRFRAAQEAKERDQMMEEVKAEMRSLGIAQPDNHGPTWDSNVITPGTDFMHKLSTYIWFYVLDRMNKNPAWRDIKVVFSDSSVPGEGEHKIMQFIRNQRSQPDFDCNQKHILHGLDADLIMLALATHEVHFTILREEVPFGRSKEIAGEISPAQRLLDVDAAALAAVRPNDEWVYSKRLQITKIYVLREYLSNEFKSLVQTLPFEYDFERVIDDFVFMCFFVGNDFLPHLPSLDIRDGAIDFLIECYKEMLPSLGNYLTSPGGNLNLRQIDVILGRVGEIEDEVFRRRKYGEDAADAREKNQANQVCHQFQRGHCSRGEKCRFQHVMPHQDSVKFKPSFEMMANAKSHLDAVPAAQPLSTAVKNDNNEVKSEVTQQVKIEEGNNLSAAEKLKANLKKKRKLKDEDMDRCQIESKEEDTENEDSSKTLFDETDIKANEEETESVIDGNKRVKVEHEGTVDTENEGYANGEVESKSDVSDQDEAPLEDIDEEEEDILHKAAAVSVAADEAAAELKKRMAQREKNKIDSLKREVKDEVKFHEKGAKARYYGEKHKKADITAGGGLGKMCKNYIEGLAWVFQYYYKGCPSWSWYYNFHYAPFASDLVNVDLYEIQFEEHRPFRPLEQLLAVLPADSKKALPDCCQWLMTDSDSPIIDIYDDNVPIDPNGKHLPHLWVLLLPFLEESRINEAFKLCESKMDEYDLQKNQVGKEVVFLHNSNALVASAIEVLNKEVGSDDGVLNAVEFDSLQGKGMAGKLSKASGGFVTVLDGLVRAPPRPLNAWEDLTKNQVSCFTYDLPEDNIHVSCLLVGAKDVPRELLDYDLVPRKPPRLNRGRFNIVDIIVQSRMTPQQQQQYNGVMAPMGYPEYRAPPMASPFQQPFMQMSGYLPPRPPPPPRPPVNFDQRQFRAPPPSMQYQEQRVCERNSQGGSQHNDFSSGGRGFSHSAPRGYSHHPPQGSQGKPADPRLNRRQPQTQSVPVPPKPPNLPTYGMSGAPRNMSYPRPPSNAHQTHPSVGNHGYGGAGYSHGYHSTGPGPFNLQHQVQVQTQQQYQQRNYPPPPPQQQQQQQQRQSRDPRRR